MTIDISRIRQYLKTFDLQPLFIEELGWDHHSAEYEALVDGQTFTLTAIAEKRGMTAFRCASLEDGTIPDYPTRRKIERQTTQWVHEHIIVYTDTDQTTQVWQWVKRETGKPTACREHPYNYRQPGDALIQKIQALAFSLEEEGQLTLFDVTTRAQSAFDVERVTKRFYDRFQAEHTAFLKFLKGIPDKEMQRWYVSVMLNRLMFIYFVQKKGFLDNDTNYLQTKLSQSKQQHEDGFYTEFLCPLFFEGFAKREEERSDSTNQLLRVVGFFKGNYPLRPESGST